MHNIPEIIFRNWLDMDVASKSQKELKLEQMKDFIITEHAYFEMQRRDISEQIVRKVLEGPDQFEEVRPDRRVYQSKIKFKDSNRTYLIRVFVDIDREPLEVVTVYRTSKIEKYWRK